MRRSLFVSVRCSTVLALVAVVMIASATPGYAAGSTARAALEDAIETARKWHPDAILTSVYTASADVDGKGASWSYGFYSPKAGNYLNVTSTGRAINTLEVSVGQTEAVPADFLDSDQVVAEATKSGVMAQTMRMRLTKTEWLVNTGDQKGALTVWLNPRTGKVIKRQTVQ